ncbi:hypothetical protein EK904_002984 [Melospiza melodia maxima]|nr:hypothetical protein EK904_002984 [Melospiza melodia maxima]
MVWSSPLGQHPPRKHAAVMKLQFEPSGNCDRLCAVPPLAALPPRTPPEWPHGEEDEVGIHSHMASPSGRILTAPGTDTVPGCPGNKGSVWYAPPTGTHAENMEMETGCTVMDRYLCTCSADNESPNVISWGLAGAGTARYPSEQGLYSSKQPMHSPCSPGPRAGTGCHSVHPIPALQNPSGLGNGPWKRKALCQPRAKQITRKASDLEKDV